MVSQASAGLENKVIVGNRQGGIFSSELQKKVWPELVLFFSQLPLFNRSKSLFKTSASPTKLAYFLPAVFHYRTKSSGMNAHQHTSMLSPPKNLTEGRLSYAVNRAHQPQVVHGLVRRHRTARQMAPSRGCCESLLLNL